MILEDREMIRYDILWKTMKEKNVSQYRLIVEYNISRGLLDRLKKNQGVTTHTIDTLCNILDCDVCDVVEHIKENTEDK